jgi:cytochrome c553
VTGRRPPCANHRTAVGQRGLLRQGHALALTALTALSALVVLVSPPAAAQVEPPDAATIAANVCAACHGPDGNSLIPMFPKIAGLQPSYVVKQLRDFQAGRRRSDVMAPVLAGIKPQDFAPLAAHFAALKLQPAPVTDKKAADLGKLIYFDGNEDTGVPACVGCHQPAGAGHLIYPRIGGQQALYIKQQLKNFASGERANDPNRFMRVVAQRLSDEEMDAVAAYLSGLDAR